MVVTKGTAQTYGCCEHLWLGPVGPAVGLEHHGLRDCFAMAVRFTLLWHVQHGVRLVGIDEIGVRVVDNTSGGVVDEGFGAVLTCELEEFGACGDIDVHVVLQAEQEHGRRDEVEDDVRLDTLENLFQSRGIAYVALVVVRFGDLIVVEWAILVYLEIKYVYLIFFCSLCVPDEIDDGVIAKETTAL